MKHPVSRILYDVTILDSNPLSRCPKNFKCRIFLYVNLVVSYLCQSDKRLLVNLHGVLSVSKSVGGERATLSFRKLYIRSSGMLRSVDW